MTIKVLQSYHILLKWEKAKQNKISIKKNRKNKYTEIKLLNGIYKQMNNKKLKDILENCHFTGTELTS